jgi:hypothetical protein
MPIPGTCVQRTVQATPTYYSRPHLTRPHMHHNSSFVKLARCAQGASDDSTTYPTSRASVASPDRVSSTASHVTWETRRYLHAQTTHRT